MRLCEEPHVCISTPISNTIFNPGKRNLLPFLNPKTFPAEIPGPAWGQREPAPTVALPNQGSPLYNKKGHFQAHFRSYFESTEET